MKKFIFGLVMAFISVLSVSAQSIEFHQSYAPKSDNAPYAATRVIASHFWTSKNEKMNLFTWNAIDRNATNTVLYTEHQIGKSNFYVHPEVRFDYWYGCENSNSYDFKPMVGVAYLLPIKNGPAIYVTPKVMTTYDNVSDGWTNPDLQVSINSSYENDKVYYEGYIDTNWIKNEGERSNVGVFAEQKAYYKMTDKFQIGGSVVFTAGKLAPAKDDVFVQPYLSVRVTM